MSRSKQIAAFFATAMSVALTSAAIAEPMITYELRSHELPDNVGNDAIFHLPFKNIPNLSEIDYANSDIGNGVRITVPGGELAPNSGPVYDLVDGIWPGFRDSPRESVFFKDDSPRGLLMFDLTEQVNVVEINTYSRHEADRTPQRYRLYTSSQAIAPATSGNLVGNGWELLASVNMLMDPLLDIDREGNFNGVAGTNIRDDRGGQLGQFRFVLMEALGVAPGARLGTFYSEIDIVGSPDPVSPPQCDLTDDGICDAIDLQLLMAAGNLVAGVPVINDLDKQRDINADSIIDGQDLGIWLVDAARANEVERYYRGDSNLNGRFDSSDLTLVFQVGQYEDQTIANSTWATGDWNGDRDFTSSDLVVAFQDGGYERVRPSHAQAVPEPTASVLLLVASMGLLHFRRASRP